jgi:hypothetical protein
MIRMKKVIALVMCIAMIACFAVTASADDAVTFTASNHENAKVGDVLEVVITVPEYAPVGALELTIKYDDNYLEPTFIQKGPRQIWYTAGDAISNAAASFMSSDGYNTEKGAYIIAVAAAEGLFDGTKLVTVYAKVKAELPEEGAIIDVEVAACDHYETGAMEAKAIDGLVKGEKKAPVTPDPKPEDPKPEDPKPEDPKPEDPKPEEPVAPQEPVDTDTDTDSKNPGTGDATGIAVAAGLCAVMAAAFVITKKVND